MSKVYLLGDGQKIALEKTIDDTYEKTEEGTILHTRTLLFLGQGEDLKLSMCE